MTIDEIIKFVNGEYVTAIGIIASILSLIISFFVLINVRRIRRSYLFRARVPELIEKLSNTASSISEQLNYFDGMTVNISKTLGDAEVNLKSLKSKVKGELNKDVKLLLSQIDSLNSMDTSFFKSLKKLFGKESSVNNENYKIKIQKIYVSLYKITEKSKNILDDYQWGN